jgi:hypothetical protein
MRGSQGLELTLVEPKCWSTARYPTGADDFPEFLSALVCSEEGSDLRSMARYIQILLEAKERASRAASHHTSDPFRMT